MTRARWNYECYKGLGLEKHNDKPILRKYLKQGIKIFICIDSCGKTISFFLLCMFRDFELKS